jgi:hypothetical protein
MSRSRAAVALSVGTLFVLASVFAAAPASAATLPSGQQIDIVDFEDGQFYNASPVNADVTPYGTSVVEGVAAIDVNDLGQGFAVSNEEVEGNPAGSSVHKADAKAGTLMDAHGIIMGDILVQACTAIDLSAAGTVAAICSTGNGEGGFIQYVGLLDPSTGLFTAEFELSDLHYFTALATNPLNGVLYAFSVTQGPGQAWAIDFAADTATNLGVDLSHFAYGADFDREGKLWITTDVEITQGDSTFFYPALATLDLASGAAAVVGLYTTPDAEVVDFSEALTVWGPALAATGSEVDATPIALGAVLLLLAGAAFAATSRIARARSVA